MQQLTGSRTLIATIKDFGSHPCPRCSISINQIHALSCEDDWKWCEESRHQDKFKRCKKVDDACNSLYEEGYAITGDHIDGLLRDESLVPTMVAAHVSTPFQVSLRFVQNTFSATLAPFGFDFHKMLTVDLLHEVELGVWKALLIHLFQMLHTCKGDKIHWFDEWYVALIRFSWLTCFRWVSGWFLHSVCLVHLDVWDNQQLQIVLL